MHSRIVNAVLSRVVAVALSALVVAPVFAADPMMPAGVRSADAALLEGTPLEVLAPYIGDWEVSTAWSNGMDLWARNEYRVLMGGSFVDVLTWARDGDGAPYLRYYTVYRWDPETESIIARGFQSDGSSEALTLEPAEGGGFVTEWGAYPAKIRQRVGVVEGDAYRWRVWMLPAADADAVEMIDARWERREGAREEEEAMMAHEPGPPRGAYPIDSGLFVGTGEACRSFSVDGVIGAPASRIFSLLTTEDGLREVYGIDSRVELRVGGPYEWYFLDENPYGTKGGEGNQVLAWVPDKTLVVSWNAPPEQPESRAKRTWVVMSLDERDDGATALTITHAGFGDGEHWDETRAYFEAAWPRVIAALRAAAEK